MPISSQYKYIIISVVYKELLAPVFSQDNPNFKENLDHPEMWGMRILADWIKPPPTKETIGRC